jgi:peptide/nickel transport system substrate-binding protein
MGGDSYDRRQFIKYTGTVAVSGAMAGCTGDDGSGGTDTTTSETDGTTTETTTTPSLDTSIGITQGQFAKTLDRHNYSHGPTARIMEQAYEKPMTLDRDAKIVGMLATEWERLSDTKIKLTIRDGVPFHNGDEMTAEDVAYSIRRLTQDDVGLSAPQADSLGPIESASVVDDGDAVEIAMGGLNPAIFTLIAGKLGIGEKSWWQDRSKAEIAKQINGTGPYQLDSYEQGVSLTYSKFDDYWDAENAGNVSEVTYTSAKESSTRVSQLVTGETDFIADVPPQSTSRISNSDNARIEPSMTTRNMYTALHDQQEPFTSLKFRKAMNHAVNDQQIIDQILNGLGERRAQPIPKGYVGFNPDIDPYPYDPDKAERLVEESGFAGAEIELHTPVGRYLKDVAVAEAIAGQVDQLSNVTASAKQRDFTALVDQIIEETPPKWFMIGWGNTTFDGSTYIKPMLTSDGYFTSFHNNRVDELVAEAEKTGDPAERDETYQEISKICHDQAAWIYLYQTFTIYGVNDQIDWSPRLDEKVLVKEMNLK